jgi:hypothetical protein
MAHPTRIAPLLLLLSGCLYDGAYVIRGTVTAPGSDGEAEPLPGASVTPKNGGAGAPQWAATTAPDGTYRALYHYGGMGLLLFVPGPGDPHVDFTAPGRPSKTVRLLGDETIDGVTKRRCDEPKAPPCFVVDVQLSR